jgi:hypothetical protein
MRETGGLRVLDQIAKGWKKLIVIVASPQSAAPEANPKRDASIRADASYSARYEEAQLADVTVEAEDDDGDEHAVPVSG